MAHHLIVPAAGRGERFGGPIAKQYRELCGVPIIERTLQQLTHLVDFQTLSVGLAEDDSGWPSSLQWRRVPGGASRAETVLGVLDSLEGVAADDDWVWVHDAVRPFVSAALVSRLTAALESGVEAVVAGLPVADTLKQIDVDQRVVETLDRSMIWCAQTPQIARYAQLQGALKSALDDGTAVTDEAMALELKGIPVKMVPGSEENFKITRPGDLDLAEFIYMKRGS